MNPVGKIFCFALVLGSALGGGHGGQRLSRGVLAAGPVYSKTVAAAPLVYSKSYSVPAAAAVSYAAPAYEYAAPAAVGYAAAPAVAYAGHGYAGHALGYAAAPAVGYAGHGHIAYSAPAIPAAPVALLSTAGKPSVYGKSIPAAAIRNVETVMVTKTITPVVTKTTTHHTAAEPALSLGHVQGYSQAAVGHPKLAPVQFNTQYTSYANPTVGVNGPVVYSGAAVGVAPVGIAAGGVGVAAVPEPVVAKAAVPVAAAVYKSSALGYAAPAAVYKGAHAHVAAAPAYSVYSAAAPGYAVLPGAALSYDTYGYDAAAAPLTNFLELKSGAPVLSGYHKK